MNSSRSSISSTLSRYAISACVIWVLNHSQPLFTAIATLQSTAPVREEEFLLGRARRSWGKRARAVCVDGNGRGKNTRAPEERSQPALRKGYAAPQKLFARCSAAAPWMEQTAVADSRLSRIPLQSTDPGSRL